MGWELDWLENRARLSPASVAIIEADKNHSWTYNEVNARANAVASSLRIQGVKKGDRVALLSPNDICYFDFLFACGKLGAIFVPVNWRLSGEEINYILEDNPKLVDIFLKRDRILALFSISSVMITINLTLGNPNKCSHLC